MGAINIKHTGAGSDITLSSDGTDLLLNGTAIGGGGGSALELYAENPSSPTAPSATGTNAVAVGDQSVSAGTRSIALGYSRAGGTDSFAAAIGSNTSSYGAVNTTSVALGGFARASNSTSVAIGYQSNTTANGAFAIGQNAASSGALSVSLGWSANATAFAGSAIGYNAKAVTGSNATALTNSYASGADSLAAAIANNTSTYGATEANSVAIGYLAKATGIDAFAIGDAAQATATGAMAFGRDSIASGQTSLALGRLNTASGSSSFALGLQNDATRLRTFAVGYNAKSETSGKFAFAAGSWAFGKVANQGQAQNGLYILISDTTDATPDILTGDNKSETGSADTTNQIILPNNSAYAFHGTIVARQQASAGTASAAWKIEGLIRREGTAGTTVLVNSATTVLDNTPSWGMALSADTTNGGLKIEVTGAAATNIRWVATVHTSEVTY